MGGIKTAGKAQSAHCLRKNAQTVLSRENKGSGLADGFRGRQSGAR